MDAIHFACELCGRGLEAPASTAGERMVCPHCDGLIVVPRQHAAPPPLPAPTPEPESAVAVRQVSYPERQHTGATTLAWAISLVLHAALFLTFSGITWLSGLGHGSEGLEVGIGSVDEGPDIQKGDATLRPIDTPSAKLEAPEITQPVKLDTITDLVGTTDRKADSILGIEAAAGGSAAAMKGDWSAFVARGGGSGGGGASFFGLEARGRKFVYVVDRSSSMHGGKILAAKSEVVRSISGLRRNMRFYIIFYNERAEAMQSNDLVKATEQSKRRYFTWVDGVPPRGGTDPTEAMRLALSLKPDAVWLLSDGLFGDQCADAIRAANPGAKIQIHTIAFYDNAGERILRRIAEENRGHYRFVPPAAVGLRRRR